MRVLHLSAQRPSHTGSGTTLANLVAVGSERGIVQEVACGLPGGVDLAMPVPTHPLRFESEALPFPIPGMSDVMPYTASRYRDLDESQLVAYRRAWRAHLARVVDQFRPDVIHAHHLWLTTSLATDLGVPVVAHCHATGLRQRALCPHLVDEVDAGIAHAAGIVALTEGQAKQVRTLWPEVPVTPVGAGYRADVFHARHRRPARGRIVYVGKLARSKGLPWLIDAFVRLRERRPEVTLHVCGLGSGEEGEALTRRLREIGAYHEGMLTPSGLADRLREGQVFVLPSLFEGYGLVLIEALACGNRLVATGFDAARDDLKPRVGEALHLVDLPPLLHVDEPDPDALPDFVHRLEQAMDRALDAGPVSEVDLHAFTWESVFDRVARVWAAAAQRT
ncbi:MAG: glycosyltransferase [Deltaproteobacteria bacterium]|nr:MAG: glycosyltransferase [Deltaproteobacteria bacterium]